MGFDTTGIDPSEPSLRAAAAHARAGGLDIRYEPGAGNRCPSPTRVRRRLLLRRPGARPRSAPGHLRNLPGPEAGRRVLLRHVQPDVAQPAGGHQDRPGMEALGVHAPPDPRLRDVHQAARDEDRCSAGTGSNGECIAGRSSTSPPFEALGLLRRRARGELTYRDLGERIRLVESGRSRSCTWVAPSSCEDSELCHESLNRSRLRRRSAMDDALTTAKSCRHYAMCKIDFLGSGVCPSGPGARLRQLLSAGTHGPLSPRWPRADPGHRKAVEIAETCDLCGKCDYQCYFVTEMRPSRVMTGAEGSCRRRHLALGRRRRAGARGRPAPGNPVDRRRGVGRERPGDRGRPIPAIPVP